MFSLTLIQNLFRNKFHHAILKGLSCALKELIGILITSTLEQIWSK